MKLMKSCGIKGGNFGDDIHLQLLKQLFPAVARQACLVAINPRNAPQVVIDPLRRCSRVLAESLHSGICADAMGIPWATCVLAHRFNEFKWRDGLESLHRSYEP